MGKVWASFRITEGSVFYGDILGVFSLSRRKINKNTWSFARHLKMVTWICHSELWLLKVSEVGGRNKILKDRQTGGRTVVQ